MAATAQDSTAPLRSGEGKKDEDREEESAWGGGVGGGLVGGNRQVARQRAGGEPWRAAGRQQGS
jgi:hypothetical protein